MFETFLMYLSWAWICLYAFGWLSTFITFTWVLNDVQRKLTTIKVNGVGLFGFIAAIAYLVAFYGQ